MQHYSYNSLCYSLKLIRSNFPDTRSFFQITKKTKEIILKNKHSGDFFIGYANTKLVKKHGWNQKLL